MSSTSPTPAAPAIRPDRAGRVLISVVLSFRNEAETIPVLLSRIDQALAREDLQYELIFVNDASTDNSLQVLMRERESNPRVKILNMSRRFGVAECLMAGLAAASGDAIVYLDTDLQDPPEVIPTLLARWRSGADVVHTVRTRRRGESAFKMWVTGLAYRAIQFGSPLRLPVDAGDFKLLSRTVVQHMLNFRESDPYMRGLVVWVGFTQAFVSYEREPRHIGKTHFPLFGRGPLKAFLVGLTSFSFLPIYVCGALAMAGLLISLTLGVLSLVLMANAAATATSVGLAAAIGFLWSTAVGTSAVVGLYVIRIYKDVRQRPLYIVESTVGMPRPGSLGHAVGHDTSVIERTKS